jgi:hypothetical protein
VYYPNKRAMIQEILKKNGYLDWYIAQPDKRNPDNSNAKCVLFNFVERKRADLIIPDEWFQRYHRIDKLIRLAIRYSTPVATYRLPPIHSLNASTSSRECSMASDGEIVASG